MERTLTGLQGTIPGITLLLLYVNNIPNVATSTAKLFADDTKISRELDHVNDTSALKSDLDSLKNWTRSLHVKFNPQKCEVTRITHKQDKSKHPYYLSNTELKSVNSYKETKLIEGMTVRQTALYFGQYFN